jgi:hypothetical protein
MFSGIAGHKGYGLKILKVEQFSPDIRNCRSAPSFTQHAEASKRNGRHILSI